MALNIIKRKGSPYWFFTATIRGKRYLVSLRTTDKTLATRMARARKKAIQDGTNEEWLESGLVKKTVPTLAALMEAYAAAPLDLIGLKRERTRSCNLGALRAILAATGIDPAIAPITALDEKAIGLYESKALEKGLRPVSVRSYLRQAGSVVGGKVARFYRKQGLLVEGEGLRLTTSVKAPRKGKRLPPLHVREGILDKLRALKQDPDTAGEYEAFLLCYGLGLRANEAAACRLTWFYHDDQGTLCCHVISRPEESFDPKGSERSIPLDNDLFLSINRAAACKNNDYIIQGATKTERHAVVNKRLAAAMRAAGWPGPKFAHELRAWRGSEWWSKAGPQWAKAWLGHRSIATTEGYYASTTSNGTAVPTSDL